MPYVNPTPTVPQMLFLNVYFLDYNWISVFSFLFPLSKSSLLYISSHSVSNSWPLSSDCYCMHTCVCIWIYIPNYNLWSPYSITCMHCFQGWWFDWTVWCSALPWGGPPLCFHLYSVACSSLCRVETSLSFPHPVWHVRWRLAHVCAKNA